MKKTKMQLGKKLFLNKDHLITLTADQSNAVAGGGTIALTAKISFVNDNLPCIQDRTVAHTCLKDTCMRING